MRTIYYAVTIHDGGESSEETYIEDITKAISKYVYMEEWPEVTCYPSATALAAEHVDYYEAWLDAMRTYEARIDAIALAGDYESDLPTVGSEMVRLLSAGDWDFDSRKVAIYETVEEPFRSDGYTVTVAMDRNLSPTADFVEIWNKFFAHHLVGVYDMKTVKKSSKTYIHFRRK